MHDVFISYSHADIDVAKKICEHLESKGIRCWYAKRNIKSGEVWADSIIDAIHKAKAFIIIFSKDSNSSPHVLSEITNAVDCRCNIVPFRIDDTQMNNQMSFYLMPYHWHDAATQSMDKALFQLSEHMVSLLGITTSASASKPNPKPEIKPIESKTSAKKSSKRLILCVVLAVVIGAIVGLSTIGLIVSSIFSEKNQQSDEQVSNEQLLNKQEELFSFVRYTDVYPFSETNGITSDGKLVVIQNEDYTLDICKLSDNTNVASSIEYLCDNLTQVQFYGSLTADCFFFVNGGRNTLDIYNRENGTFIYDAVELLENEIIAWGYLYEKNILLGTEKGTDFSIVTSDTDGKKLLRSIHVSVTHTDDGPTVTYQYRSLEKYGLVTIVAGYLPNGDAPDENKNDLAFVTAVVDGKTKIKLLDVKKSEVLDIDDDTLREEYLPHAFPVNNVTQLSPGGSYLLQMKSIQNETTYQILDIKGNGKCIFEASFSENCKIEFISETEIACFDAKNSSFYLYDLTEQKKTAVLLDEKIFNEKSDVFFEFPFSFHYVRNLDCFILNDGIYVEDKGYFKHQAVFMDKNGEIIARNKPVPVEFTVNGYGVYVMASDNVIFYAVCDSVTWETKLYLCSYSMEDGKIKITKKE